jgi:hypothetical protein
MLYNIRFGFLLSYHKSDSSLYRELNNMLTGGVEHDYIK